MEFQAVLDAVRAWPADDQARLVGIIQDELESESEEMPLSEEQVAEIRRRVEAHEKDPSTAIPWEEFEAHIDHQLKELGE